MELFHKILKTPVAGGASDIHLKTGTPVVFRINRELLAIECANPTEEWMNQVVEQVTPAHLKTRLEQEREIDFSYFVPGIGRFRTNLFQQRGQWCLAMRYVKTILPNFEELGLLEQIRQIAESPRGIVLVAGTTGCGKSTTLAAMIEHINANFKKYSWPVSVRAERPSGTFVRQLPLPPDAHDEIHATFGDGVLELRVPRAGSESEPRAAQAVARAPEGRT